MHDGRARDGARPREVGVGEEPILLNVHRVGVREVHVPVDATALVPPAAAAVAAALIAVVGVDKDGDDIAALVCVFRGG